VRLMKGLV